MCFDHSTHMLEKENVTALKSLWDCALVRLWCRVYPHPASDSLSFIHLEIRSLQQRVTKVDIQLSSFWMHSHTHTRTRVERKHMHRVHTAFQLTWQIYICYQVQSSHQLLRERHHWHFLNFKKFLFWHNYVITGSFKDHREVPCTLYPASHYGCILCNYRTISKAGSWY